MVVEIAVLVVLAVVAVLIAVAAVVVSALAADTMIDSAATAAAIKSNDCPSAEAKREAVEADSHPNRRLVVVDLALDSDYSAVLAGAAD